MSRHIARRTTARYVSHAPDRPVGQGRTLAAMRTIDTGTDDLLGEVDEGVATLTLNRPERRNAMSQAMNEALGGCRRDFRRAVA